jgi:hypothetical protein
MMSYTLNKEELFCLCVLSGANSLLGIEDVSISLSQEEMRSKWSEVGRDHWPTNVEGVI